MVTMEDLLEELVGTSGMRTRRSSGISSGLIPSIFLISGDLTIRDLFDQLDLPFSNLKSNHTSCGVGP